ncbi:hypothetical protein [Luteipulveratus mongoliensis]|uniref:Prokaryotic phospholipase A2 n=1 Tax=Luteipulveratus mongoliensis TaxID=571913 RepID=A0A0K1JIT6_9MICO|nr:hypothetical protein [Luteipulveratus mongoliensis]AKU16627.1 hypothetical protein VV02_13405 [Luteipulveratus mongoliensis]
MTTTTVRRLAATLALSGCAWATIDYADRPADTSFDPTHERAVVALVHEPGLAARQALPAGFADRKGYQPEVEHGALVNPSGDCSSPIPLPGYFTAACRQHDLGYDLIRDAAKTSGPLPASARRSVDDQFDRTTHAACEQRSNTVSRGVCDLWASSATLSVRINSWRQHWSTPGHESPLSVASGAAAVMFLGAGAALAGLGLGSTRRVIARSLTAVDGPTQAVHA